MLWVILADSTGARNDSSSSVVRCNDRQWFGIYHAMAGHSNPSHQDDTASELTGLSSCFILWIVYP